MQISENVVHQKMCKKCKFIYFGDDIRIVFRLVLRSADRKKYRRSVCKICDQKKRDKKKGNNLHSRWRTKARSTRRSHSRRLEIPEDVLENKHGWNLSVMAHEAAHQYDNGCSECHKSYREMGNGLFGISDITLDIRDRDLEPDYSSNTFWICGTCNQAKGSMLMKDWVVLKRLHRENVTWIAELQAIPKPVQPALFDMS